MSVPELRFPEFEGEWEDKNLGDIAKFSKGKNISKKDISEQGIPCIRYGELYTTYKEKITDVFSKTDLGKDELVFSSKNDIIIPTSGETAIDLATASCILNEGVAIGGDTNIIKTKGDGLFFSYYLNSKRKNIAKLAQGVSVVHLYSTHLKILDLKVPRIEEQVKIASFLSAVDEKIEKLEKKVELWEVYKKGMMQKIFSQESRFKDENREDYPDWEEKRFEEVMVKGKAGGTPTSTNKNFYGGPIPFLSIADMTSQGKYIQYTEKYITEEGLEKSSAWLVPKNSLIYSIYASVGSVAINKSDITTSQAIFGIILKEKKVNLEYIYYYLLDYQKYIHKFIETGTQGNLNAKTVRNLIIKLPKMQEQSKISDFLSSIDKKIDQLEKEIQFNKEFKKGLLQKMFC